MIYPNPLARYDVTTKADLFAQDVADGNGFAFMSSGAHAATKRVPLAGLDIGQVEYIGAAWRVQQDFPHVIQNVRDRQFVIGEHLNRHEQNMFEYYSARMVGFNCYGPYVIGAPLIVACFNAGAGAMWAYGPSIEHARAFLAISLFDRNRDLIVQAERAKQACTK